MAGSRGTRPYHPQGRDRNSNDGVPVPVTSIGKPEGLGGIGQRARERAARTAEPFARESEARSQGRFKREVSLGSVRARHRNPAVKAIAGASEQRQHGIGHQRL